MPPTVESIEMRMVGGKPHNAKLSRAAKEDE
jgi:hypothetical protein